MDGGLLPAGAAVVVAAVLLALIHDDVVGMGMGVGVVTDAGAWRS